MKPFLIIAIAATLSSTSAGLAKDLAAELLSLSPDTRLEQRCNGQASGSVRREHQPLKPDEVVAYAFADVKISGQEVDAPGAAIRSKGKWYHLSYRCLATPDGLGIQSFTYSLGDVVPESDWERHYLVH